VFLFYRQFFFFSLFLFLFFYLFFSLLEIMTHYKYVVTAQKPTATHFAAKGVFTAPYDTNLVLG
jgi:hypothetical protein